MISSTGTTVDKTVMDVQKKVFKTEIDALLVKYPELKTAMPTIRKGMGGKMHRGNGEVEAIIATLPTSTQTELRSIHDSYQSKQETLRAEEKAKIDTVLTGYPDVKTKLDALQANRPQGDGMMGRGGHGRSDRQDQETSSSAQ
jgi:hypothetical protein